MGFDGVVHDQVGAGVAGFGVVELLADRCQRTGASGCGQRVERDMYPSARQVQVTGDGQCFPYEAAGLIGCAGVVGGGEAG